MPAWDQPTRPEIFWTFASNMASYNGRTMTVTQTRLGAWFINSEAVILSTKMREVVYIAETRSMHFIKTTVVFYEKVVNFTKYFRPTRKTYKKKSGTVEESCIPGF